MQKTVLTIILVIVTTFAIAQKKQHKIVFDLSSGDTAIQSAVLRQFNNTIKPLQYYIRGGLPWAGHQYAVKNKMFFKNMMSEFEK